jgi:hypothetical protein
VLFFFAFARLNVLQTSSQKFSQTPAAPTAPIIVAREVDQGLQPIARHNDVAQDRAATQQHQRRGSPISPLTIIFSRP